MKGLAIFGVVFVLVIASSAADAADRKNDHEMERLSREVRIRMAYRSSEAVRVSALNCRLHVEFGLHHVAFDLPLRGTTVEHAEADNGLVLVNPEMTRTVREGAPERFERLILRIEPDSVREVHRIFESAIAGCGG